MDTLKLKDDRGEDFEITDFEEKTDETFFIVMYDNEHGRWPAASLPKDQAKLLAEWILEKLKED